MALPGPARAHSGAAGPFADIVSYGQPDEQALENVRQAFLDAGAHNHMLYSLLLIHESRSALARNEPTPAIVLAEYAAKISPDLPPARMAAARARWSDGKLRVHELAAGYAGAWWKKLRHGEALFFMLAAGMQCVLGAFLCTLALLSLISLSKYARLLYHDVRHAAPAAVPGPALIAGFVVVLLLPALCGMSVFWLCIYWLVLLYGYLSSPERAWASGLTVFFALGAPLLVAGIAFGLFVLQSDQMRDMWRAHSDYCDERCVERCERSLSERPGDAEMLFTLGLVHKKRQNYHTAKTYYERALARAPGDYRVHTNLGNVNLALQQWDDAVENYRAAVALAPSRAAAAHFNHARAFQQKFMFKEAEQQFVQAKRLDRTRVDRLLVLYSENYNRLLMDEVLPRTAFVKRAYGKFAGHASAAGELWSLYFTGAPVSAAPLIVLCAWAATLYCARRQTFRVSRACSLCGKVLCKRCQRIITSEVLCTQCHNFLQKQEKMSHALRSKKTAQIMRHVQRLFSAGTLLSWAVPGAGHIWKGKPAAGVITGFCFFLLLMSAVLPWLFEGPWDAYLSTRMENTALLGAAALVYWYAAAVAAVRVRSREIDDNIALKNIAAGF